MSVARFPVGEAGEGRTVVYHVVAECEEGE